MRKKFRFFLENKSDGTSCASGSTGRALAEPRQVLNLLAPNRMCASTKSETLERVFIQRRAYRARRVV